LSSFCNAGRYRASVSSLVIRCKQDSYSPYELCLLTFGNDKGAIAESVPPPAYREVCFFFFFFFFFCLINPAGLGKPRFFFFFILLTSVGFFEISFFFKIAKKLCFSQLKPVVMSVHRLLLSSSFVVFGSAVEQAFLLDVYLPVKYTPFLPTTLRAFFVPTSELKTLEPPATPRGRSNPPFWSFDPFLFLLLIPPPVMAPTSWCFDFFSG